MFHRSASLLAALVLLVAGAATTPAQDGKAKDPECKYALDLRARKSTEPSFTAETRKFGVEIFTDANTSDGLHLCDTGSLAGAPAKLLKAGHDRSTGAPGQSGLTN